MQTSLSDLTSKLDILDQREAARREEDLELHDLRDAVHKGEYIRRESLEGVTTQLSALRLELSRTAAERDAAVGRAEELAGLLAKFKRLVESYREA